MFGTVPYRATRASHAIAAFSLGKPSAAYPGRVATDADLMIAVDRQQTRLALPLDTSATSMTVESAAGIGAYNLLTIDSEIVKTTGPPAGNVVPIARGFDGTAAATHLARTVVSGFIDAYHHNALVAEIEAIEARLGPNLANVPGSASIFSSAYDFAPQAPGGALTIGTNSITLTPVPEGVNGSNPSHYLYLSGGTGAAEAVLITGGSAVGGAATGTVFVTCANAHSGAWTVRSATGGIQEALFRAGQGRAVIVPGKTVGTDMFAPVTVPYWDQTVRGEGSGCTLVKKTLSGHLFVVPITSANVEIGAFMLVGDGALGSHTGGAMIYVDRSALVRLRDIRIYNCWTGIDTVGTATSTATVGVTMGSGIYVQEAKNAGMKLGTGLYLNLNVHNTSVAGVFGVDHSVADGSLIANLVIGGPFAYGMYLAPTGAQRVDNLLVANLQIDTWKQYGIYFGGAVAGGVRAINMVNTHIGNQVVDASNSTAIYMAASPQHVHFNGGRILINQKQAAILELGCRDVSFTDIAFLGNVQSSGAPVIDIRGTQAGVTIANNQFDTFFSVNPTPRATHCISFTGAGSVDVAITDNKFRDYTVAPITVANLPSGGFVLKDNLGLDEVTPTVPAAAALAFPLNDGFFLTGSSAVTSVSGLWEGRSGEFIATDAAPGAWSASATIAKTFTPTQNTPVVWTFRGGKVWLK